MAGFALCPACRAEFDDPLDRRFHAQPLACPACGPRLTFRRDGASVDGEAALAAAIAALRAGLTVAVKGVGGYHLMCDPTDDAAVARLRTRKRRPDKPLAVMVPQTGADGLDAVRDCIVLSEAEAQACADPVRPIVLARRAPSRLSRLLAPGLAELGVFLPYSPLHHLLLGAYRRAAGRNVRQCQRRAGASPRMPRRSGGWAASPMRSCITTGRSCVLPTTPCCASSTDGPRAVRVGRGNAPLEIELAALLRVPTLAVGGHMKGAVALGWGRRVVVSPHIGEIDSPRAMHVFAQVIADLQALHGVAAERIVCDAHPDYASTRWAAAQALPVVRVLHHAAHASALAGEHPDVARWLVFTWDGVGLGEDGALWGGEALLGAPGEWRRVASMRPFLLTGGDRVAREPWRSAAALMWDCGLEWWPEIDGAGLSRRRGEAGRDCAQLLGRPPVRCRRGAGARPGGRELRRAGADDAGERRGRRPTRWRCRCATTTACGGRTGASWCRCLPMRPFPPRSAQACCTRRSRVRWWSRSPLSLRRKASTAWGLPGACSRTGCWPSA